MYTRQVRKSTYKQTQDCLQQDFRNALLPVMAHTQFHLEALAMLLIYVFSCLLEWTIHDSSSCIDDVPMEATIKKKTNHKSPAEPGNRFHWIFHANLAQYRTLVPRRNSHELSKGFCTTPCDTRSASNTEIRQDRTHKKNVYTYISLCLSDM